MKSYSLQPTQENALECLCTNSLGRNEFIFQFIRLLDSIEDSCSISLNGNWGSGKTIFVKQVKLILEASNPSSNMDEKMRAPVRTKFPNGFECRECYTSVYYDAWTNDHHDDPLLSLIYAVISTKQSDFTSGQSPNYLEIAASIAELLSGKNISGVLKSLKSSSSFAQIKESEDIRLLVKEFLDALIEEHGNRLVIFIDELDRCKPDYAIRLLERIKHYFDDDRVTFVFSVCIQELQWTIKAFYGSEFSATRYLDKFFDLRVALPAVNRIEFLKTQTNFTDWNNHHFYVCAKIIDRYNFSLREIERYIRLIKIASRSLNSSSFTLEFCSIYIMPIVVALQIYDSGAYQSFIHGDDFGALFEIVNNESPNSIINKLLASQEYYKGYDPSASAIKEVSLESKFNQAYKALFSEHYTDLNPFLKIGEMRFSPSVRDKLLNAVSLISLNVNYGFE